MLYASLLPPNGLKRNMEPNKRPADERKCASKEDCLRELDDLEPNLFPVCPAFRYTRGVDSLRCTASPFEYQEPARLLGKVPQGNYDADCMDRVCRVLEYLARPLTLDVLVECAHRRNILEESLDLIRKDLNALPKRLERLHKDYPKTSRDCIHWLCLLEHAESNYAMALKEKRRLVYLVPEMGVKLQMRSFLVDKPTLRGFENIPYPPNGPFPVVDYTCDEYLSWQEQIVPNLANYLKYYPAEATGIAETLARELRGLHGALEAEDRVKDLLPQAEKDTLRAGTGKPSNEVPWNESDPHFYPFKDAIEDAQKVGCDHEIGKLDTWNNDKMRVFLRKPGCLIRWMTAPKGKQPRSRVHKSDWKTYLQDLIRQKDLFDEKVEEEAHKLV